MTETHSGALVITGGAGGIGARIARRAAAAGTPVAITYRTSAEAAKHLVAEIEADGGNAQAIAADLRDEAAIVAAFETIDQRFGGVCGLVNNAVETGQQRSLLDLQLDELQSVFATNVFGAFLCAREATKRMSTQARGSGGAIVSLSTLRAVRIGSADGWLPFGASKGALETLTRNLSVELATHGIRANTVRVGVLDTPTRRTQGEEHINRLLTGVPMHRLGDPDEVAAAVLWLLSDQASFVTGATLDVGGGQ
jgi:NAD(P)-dependent dehydrogenase (short-subunit alcohol dehydrogenase family)